MISEPFQIIHNGIIISKLEFYIKSGNGPAIQRNVFENVDYDDYEIQQISALQAKINEKGLNIRLKKSTLLKMLMAAQYDIEKAIVNCQFHLKFLKEYVKSDYSKELSRGYLYVSGFDNQYRPVIVFRQYCDIKIIGYFLEAVKRQLLIDYYVETWTIIIDLDIDLPVLELEDLLQLQLHFYGNLNKILIINGPDDIDSIVKQFIDKFPDLSFKIKIITENSQFLQYIPKEMLETRYGGNSQNIETYWPIMKRDNGITNKASHMSAISVVSSSVQKKSSFMKITVLEENGNPLLNQELEVHDELLGLSSDSGEEEKDKHQDEKQKTYQSSTTKKLIMESEDLMNMDEEEEKVQVINIATKKSKKIRDITKTLSYSQKPTILEGDKEIPQTYTSCCSRQCVIF